MTFKEFLEYGFSVAGYEITVLDLILSGIIILVTRFFFGFLKNWLLKRFFQRRRIDPGRQFATTQILGYLIYTISFFMVLQALGIQISVIWGAAAALLVGVGLGLQQTFNDLVSGIILLIEGSVEVEDVVVVDGVVGKVREIGLRTSKIKTRDDESLIIPNSKLVTEKVTNWSHENPMARFGIKVGVAYGSDVNLVTRLLLQSLEDQTKVLKTPAPAVFFRDFGESSLDFELLFYSEETFRIERIKSEIRYRIVALFRENGVEIPFPQRDVWFRSKPQA